MIQNLNQRLRWFYQAIVTVEEGGLGWSSSSSSDEESLTSSPAEEQQLGNDDDQISDKEKKNIDKERDDQYQGCTTPTKSSPMEVL
ncbi:hypothetical protein F2Q70_00016319 [Brassica cretica]|uniref:Uncharacterized protein n=1 Tax=Brassica cretica TaxID=69181 RepID=A0A8S9HUD0_BRACR|nr:hypothetical protein F2Q70_00016319 [Brassica cretica]KAF2597445.1 hypothetical protein F2Q68_00009288 [Brassica cretica]